MPDAASIDFAVDPLVALDAAELYACLRLRSEVFVVEQNCAYLDPDGLDLDPGTLHLRMRARGAGLVGYARLLPRGLDFADACSVGRIATARTARGRGHGRRLVAHALTECRRHFPGSAVAIHAQTYLRGFYAGFGFVVEGGEYLEDGIPHVDMRLAGVGTARFRG